MFSLLVQPLFNLLVFFYNNLPGHDIGLAIILLTILVRLVLWPLHKQSLAGQKALQALQPKMEAIKKQYATDKEAQTKALMELYKKEKTNPMASCLPVLIQLPIFIAIFKVFREGFAPESLDWIYPFVSRPELIDPLFLGLPYFDLSVPNYLLAFLAGVSQFFLSKLMLPSNYKVPAVKGAQDEGMAMLMNKQMIYLLPVLTIFMGLTLPGGLTLYWISGTIVMIIQQKFYHPSLAKNTVSETAKLKEAEEVEVIPPTN